MEDMKRPFLAVCTTLVLIICPLPGQEPAAVPDQEPLATLDGEPILESDLSVSPDQRKLEQQIYVERQGALSNVIATRLLNKEAAAREITREELIATEVMPKVGEPTNKEITDFYNSQEDSASKPPLKDVRERIVTLLRARKAQTHLSDFVRELWAKSEVKVFLDPPRLPINLEGVRMRGPEDAPVTIVEYSDFQCPYCRRAQPILAMVAQEYEGKIRWGFKDMPLADIHPEATRAAIAGRCADEQGMFWELRDKLFEQELFTDGMYADVAKEIGIKEKRLLECMDSGKYDAAVQADFEEARSFGVDGTPAFVVNGALLTGAQPFEVFRKTIDRELGIDVLP